MASTGDEESNSVSALWGITRSIILYSWKFLNTNFAQWFMPTVIVGSAVYLYHAQRNEEARKAEAFKTAARLDTELEFRLKPYYVAVDALLAQAEQREQISEETKSNLVNTLLALYREANRPETSAFSEFQGQSLYALLKQYEAVASEPGSVIAEQAAQEALYIHKMNLNIKGNPDIATVRLNLGILAKVLKGGYTSNWTNKPTWNLATALTAGSASWPRVRLFDSRNTRPAGGPEFNNTVEWLGVPETPPPSLDRRSRQVENQPGG